MTNSETVTICAYNLAMIQKRGLKARHSDWQTTGLTWDGHFNLKGKMGVLKTLALLSPLLHDAITHEETQHYHQTTMKAWNHLIILQCLFQSAPVMAYSCVSQNKFLRCITFCWTDYKCTTFWHLTFLKQLGMWTTSWVSNNSLSTKLITSTKK